MAAHHEPDTSQQPDELDRGRRRLTPRDAARIGLRAGVDWVRHSPGTHIWLVILAITSGLIATASPSVRNFLLHHNSTNLVQLRDHPVRVLIVSALWIESPSGFAFYFAFYEMIHAPAERWLGTRRWLLTVAVAHVGATLVSQQAVRVGIQYESLPRSMAHTVDIGVSYGLAGVVGVLTYLVPRPWRWGYAVLITGFFGWSVVNGRTFTDLGHFTALLLGLACYALTPTARRRRPRPRGRRSHLPPHPIDGSRADGIPGGGSRAMLGTQTDRSDGMPGGGSRAMPGTQMDRADKSRAGGTRADGTPADGSRAMPGTQMDRPDGIPGCGSRAMPGTQTDRADGMPGGGTRADGIPADGSRAMPGAQTDRADRAPGAERSAVNGAAKAPPGPAQR